MESSLIASFDRETDDEDFDLLKWVRALAAQSGWPSIIAECIAILSAEDQQRYWHQATVVIYWAVSDRAELPLSFEALAARLYRCLELYPGFGGSGLSDGENLVWSIVSNLKGVRYDSEWDPYQDAGIQAQLARLRGPR